MTAAVAAHRLPLRVYYEDTDAAGIVYYANYLKFAERGRTEWMRALGFDHARLHAERGVRFAVRRCEIDYLQPARLDELLVVETAVGGVRGARLLLDQSVLRQETALCRLSITLVLLDDALRPVRLARALPPALLQALEALAEENRGRPVS